jgi:hypothetical protein
MQMLSNQYSGGTLGNPARCECHECTQVRWRTRPQGQMPEAWGSIPLSEPLTGERGGKPVELGPAVPEPVKSYVKRKTAAVLEGILVERGKPINYDDAIAALLLSPGCRICKDPKHYFKTLRIVLAQNNRFTVTEEVVEGQGWVAKVGLAAWEASAASAQTDSVARRCVS